MMRARTLLDDIKAEISAAGGRYKLAAILIRESPGWFNHRDKAKVKKGINGINKTRRYREKNPKKPISSRNRRWADEDILFLKKKYGVLKTGTIAKILNRTRYAIGLKFSEVATEAEKEWVMQNGIFAGKSNLKRK